MFVRLTVLGCTLAVIGSGAWILNQTYGQGSEEQQITETPNDTPLAVAAVKKDEAKILSLVEAISLVEKSGKGEVVKAEKMGNAEKTQFNIEVVDKDGKRRLLHVNGTGKVMADNAPPTKNKKKEKEKEYDRERESEKKPKKQPTPQVSVTPPASPVAVQAKNVAPGKSITLSEAIIMIEKSGKGEVIKAEKSGAGEKTQFKIDVLAGEGMRLSLQVNSTGMVMSEKSIPMKKKSKERERDDD